MAEAKKTILVVDDEPDVRDYISVLVEDNGYEATTACDGVEAMKKLKQSRPDLVTLDITMPEKSGVRCYRDIKENDEYKDIPVIIVTGVDQEFEKFISTRRQVPPPEGYIAKPIDKEKLLGLIKEHLG